jgi:hypothetical protein
MTAVKTRKEEPALEAYADEQYKKLLKERRQYVSLDNYYAQRGIK